MDQVTRFTQDGLTVRILVDPYAENPRELNSLGVMVCWHHRYNLGDSHEWEMPSEFDRSEEKRRALAILPLYLYDHSGITMSTRPFADKWDSGQVGYIYIPREKLKDYGWTRVTRQRREQLEETLRGEVETYDQYLRGEVYGFQILDGSVEMDSCYGFFGLSVVEQEAREQAGRCAYQLKQAERMERESFAL